MTAKELLSTLDSHDVRLIASGNRLRIDGPRGVLTEELLEKIRDHKNEIIENLRSRSQGSSSNISDSIEIDQIAEMELNQFAQAGLVVKVWSATLSSYVLFVSDNVDEKELGPTKLPVYRASEMRKLAILRPKQRALKEIHDVKNIFNGTISDVIPGG